MSVQPSHVRIVGEPVPTMTARAGTLMADARRKVESLNDTLRELDGVCNVLAKQHKVTIDVDLGPVGNAARAARNTLDAPHPFDRKPA